MWMAVVMDLTEEQFCEVKKMDWGVGTYPCCDGNCDKLARQLANLTMPLVVWFQPMPALSPGCNTQQIILLA